MALKTLAMEVRKIYCAAVSELSFRTLSKKPHALSLCNETPVLHLRIPLQRIRKVFFFNVGFNLQEEFWELAAKAIR